MIRKVNKVLKRYIREELIFSSKRVIEKRLTRYLQQSDQDTVINYDITSYE